MFLKKNLLAILTLSLVILANFYFGLPRLGSYAGVDEPLWSYGRVPKFWNSIARGKWKSTSLCDKPGITLAAVSGLGLPFVDGNPKDIEDLRYSIKTPEQLKIIRDLYFYLRLPVFLFAVFSLPIFYYFIRKLFDRRIALVSILFIGLSPLLLGIRLIINSDAMLCVFLPLTVFSFLVYQKENSRKFLYLSGIFMGLGLISKFVINLLFPYLFILIFLKYIFKKDALDGATYFKKAILDYAIFTLIACATVFVLYPAAWVGPKTILDVTIWSKAFHSTWHIFVSFALLMAAEFYFLNSRLTRTICDFFKKHRNLIARLIYFSSLAMIAFVVINVYSGMRLFNFESMFNFPDESVARIYAIFGQFEAILLSSFYPLIFGMTPLAAAFFLSALIISLKKSPENEKFFIFYFLFFILIYYLGSAVSQVPPTVRYQIVLYPFASIISAVGLVQILDFSAIKRAKSEAHFYFLLATVFIISLISLKAIRPHYLAYASDLLPHQYVLNLRDMGEGSWEIAQYLNDLPQARNLIVWSDKGAVCETFVGRCADSMKQHVLDNLDFDYFVVTAGRESKSKFLSDLKGSVFNGSLESKDLYNPKNIYEYRINIDDREDNYLKVIKAENITRL
jgi:4-amino-4-deoxy-L-arabinose transferase-like glycosyltransferase